MGSKNPAHTPGASSVPTTRGLTNRPSYTTVTHLQRIYDHPLAEGLGQSHEDSLVVGLESMSPHKLRSTVSLNFSIMILTLIAHIIPLLSLQLDTLLFQIYKKKIVIRSKAGSSILELKKYKHAIFILLRLFRGYLTS